ncbi:MAG: hypothetical protein HZA46_05180 [Planctomycetales bacterium]|nr:hypothetical protein [Planctomycetales bacterium]
MHHQASNWFRLARLFLRGANARVRHRGKMRSAWNVERLESRQLLATFTLPSGSTAATGADYFAIEQNNPLDYTETQNDNQAGADDRVNAGLDDPGLTSTSVSGGKYNFTTSGGGLVYLLHPGFFDNSAGGGAPRTAGLVPEEKSGESIPIDASTYFQLNMMLTAPVDLLDPGLVGGAAVQANIQWYDGRDVGTNTATHAFFVFPGTNIYSFNLPSMSTVTSASGLWTGNIAGLRIYPSNSGSPVSMSIDWVTLTGASQASLPVSITGASGNVQVGLSTDGNSANLIKLVKPPIDDINLFTVRSNLIVPTAQASVTSIDTTILGSGTYFLHSLDASGNVLSGTSALPITVNGTPRLTILQPDNRGDEATDYATLYRSLSSAPDPWDFTQTSDYLVPTVGVDATYYGVPTIATNPVTTIGGTLSGNWMQYDNSTATGGASAMGDSQFLLPITGPIDVSQYTNLTIKTLVDRTRNVGLGPFLRVGWSPTDPPAVDLSNLTQSDAIVLEQGVQELHLDLTTLKVDLQSPGQTSWSSTPAELVRYLRIDPHEYSSATTAYIDQILLTRNDRTSSGVFNITWSTADADVGQTITVSKIYLDTDRNRGNGKGTEIATNEANDGSFTFNIATVPALADGSYYVLTEFTDGVNTSSRYSTGKLDVKRIDTDATFTFPSGGTAGTGSDYFAIEQNNALDYTEVQNNSQSGADDRVNAGFDDVGLSTPTVSGGAYNFTSSGGGLVYFLHPGYSDGELIPPVRTAGVVPEEKSGESIPIDASKYFMLNMMITADGVPDPSVVGPAGVQANIQWYNARDAGGTSATRPFFVFPGTNVYSFNLSTITTVDNTSGPWTGNISGLRIFPSNYGTPVTMHIDSVTLTGSSQASLPVSITGATGSVQLGLSTDGDPANLIKFMRPPGNSDNDFLFTRTNLVAATSQASLTSIDTTILGSGTYFVHALDAGGSVLSGTSARQLIVNSIPRLTVLTPSNLGDVASDFATLFRSLSGVPDPWDFSQTSDYSVPFAQGEQSSHYGVPTIVSNPTTTVSGSLSGSWMRYDNLTATGPVNAVNDPHFLLSQPVPIDTTTYRNLTIRMLLDRPRDIPNGAVLRVMWSPNNPIVADADITQSDDVIVQQGVQELHLDLSTLKIEPLSTGQTPWLTAPSLIEYLRIDPHEFPTGTVAYFDQVLLTPNDHTSGGGFSITWNATDGNAGDPLTVSAIYLDTDKNPANGKGTLLATGLANTGSFAFNTASYPGLVVGSYFVLMEFTDGRNSSSRYSTGKLDVSPLSAGNTAPVLDNSGAPYLIAPAGSRVAAEMQTGIRITELLLRAASGNPISDSDIGAQTGIAVTAIDKTLGKWQYTFVASPAETDWIDADIAGAISNSSALLLPADANTRLRFVTTLMPRHNNTATDGSPRGVAEGFLPLETKLDTGITFRAWDRTTGTAGSRGNATTNGGSSAFSSAVETVGTYFETRLFRSFNAAAQLNTYTLEQEFNALVGSFGYQDRSTADYSGFTIFMSPIPGVTLNPLYRMYFGIAFDSPSAGIQTDMGYRYLTTSLTEVTILESIGPEAHRAERDGFYYRELGVNGGTGITGYIYTTAQPGTTEMFQIYRTDLFSKDTRTGPPGSPATGTVQQEQGDHAYTTKPNFEMTKTPGQQHIEGVQRGWRLESSRGFARELSPNAGGAGSGARRASVHSAVETPAAPVLVSAAPESSLLSGSAGSRLALPSLMAPPVAGQFTNPPDAARQSGPVPALSPFRRSPLGVFADHRGVISHPARVATTDVAALDVLFTQWDALSDLLSTP